MAGNGNGQKLEQMLGAKILGLDGYKLLWMALAAAAYLLVETAKLYVRVPVEVETTPVVDALEKR